MNPYYVWSRFIMGRPFLIAKRLEKELNAKRGEANPLVIGRRVQFYRDDPVNVLSFFDNNQAILVSSTLRKAGIPERLKAYNTTIPLSDPDKFMKDPFIKAIGYLDGKVNISVSDALFNTYNQNEIIGFDKVTLDLDISNECISIDQAREWADKVVNALKSLTGVEPIIVWSGCKGIHTVYFLNNIVEIEYLAPLRQALVKYSGLEDMGLKLDPQTQDPKHVFRLPLTTNLKSGNKAELIHFTSFSNHVLSAEFVKGLAFLYDPLPGRKILVTPSQAHSKPSIDTASKGWGCLLEWVKALIKYLEETGELCHYGRMAVAGWMLWCGFTDEEIHEVFKHAHDYRQGTTQYHINDVRKYLEQGGKPMGCETVREKCNGYKVPDLNCKSIRKPPTHPKPLEDKPMETKPEVKPEAKPESLEGQPKPTPNPQSEVPKTTPTPPTKPKAPLNTTSNNNRRNKQVVRGKQARLTGFIDKPTQPSTQTTIEEDWDKVLRPEKKKVIPCSELGDECKFFHNCLELFEWRSWSGERVFEPPRGYIEIEDLFTPEEHERLHNKLYELVINGKQQEALKLWEEIAEKELPIRIEKARRRNKELLSEWVRGNCSDSVVVNP
jgi:hypothetical protein